MLNVLLVMNHSPSLNSYPTAITQEYRPLGLAFGGGKRMDPETCVEAKIQLGKSPLNGDLGDRAPLQCSHRRFKTILPH